MKKLRAFNGWSGEGGIEGLALTNPTKACAHSILPRGRSIDNVGPFIGLANVCIARIKPLNFLL